MDTQKQENGTEDMRYGRWLWFTVEAVLATMAMLGGLVVWVDPLFHYHKSLGHLAYPIDSERYQNDGISHNFTYDAVLTGTSMMENFKTSRFDSLFGVSPVRIPYAGGYYKEVDQVVRRALLYNPQVKVACRSLDRSFLFCQKDQQSPAAPSPDYLTDDNSFNDVNYIFSKEMVFGTIQGVFARTKAGGQTTTFDEYMHWAPERDWGRKAVLETYEREPQKNETVPSTKGDRRTVMENLEQNVLATARANLQVAFYYFVLPYSISWWDSKLMVKGEFERQMEGYRLMVCTLLECRNIRLFALDDQFDITCNPDHHMDVIHCSEDIGGQLLEWMVVGEHTFTNGSVDRYFDRITDFYADYDHGSIHE